MPEPHDMKDVFSFVVFNGNFPLAKSMDGDLVDSGILKFMRGSFALRNDEELEKPKIQFYADSRSGIN
jgi:hypothetical protein